MSLPILPDREQTPSREQAISQIISSIAMEELGLSHIINAEGEKIQYVLGTIPGVSGPDEPVTIEDLLKLNTSVHKTLDSAMMNQIFLKTKLQCALSASVMQGATGATGPTGPHGPFLSSYMEALGNTQIVDGDENVVFEADSIDSVGNNIEMDSTGTVFIINQTGLYQVEWNVNLTLETGSPAAVMGILENGDPVSGSACSASGCFSSGSLIEVDSVPYIISLHNYDNAISLESPMQWQDTAASIRIVRFADGPSI